MTHISDARSVRYVRARPITRILQTASPKNASFIFKSGAQKARVNDQRVSGQHVGAERLTRIRSGFRPTAERMPPNRRIDREEANSHRAKQPDAPNRPAP